MIEVEIKVLNKYLIVRIQKLVTSAHNNEWNSMLLSVRVRSM